jgi:predicted GNAT family acetyltransferase
VAETAQNIRVRDNTEAGRFEIVVAGEVAGFSAYQRFGASIVFTHTQINPDRSEHGLGTQLVQTALDEISHSTSLRVVAQCPFVAHFIEEHPNYQRLLIR